MQCKLKAGSQGANAGGSGGLAAVRVARAMSVGAREVSWRFERRRLAFWCTDHGARMIVHARALTKFLLSGRG